MTEQELVVDAEINLDDVNELWGLELPTTEADTVGGFGYQQLCHIPIVGESFSYDGLGFSVSSMRGRGGVRWPLPDTPPTVSPAILWACASSPTGW